MIPALTPRIDTIENREASTLIQDFKPVGVVGLPLNGFDGGAYLAPTDFPNQTTLYGWRAPDTSGNWTDLGGNGKTLTLTGSLDVANDFIENSKACYFDGVNDYLSSSDAAFNFTSNFSVSFWMHKDSWATPRGYVTSGLVGRFTGNGWVIQLMSEGIGAYSNGSQTVLYATYNLTPGWHHVAYTFGSTAKLYIDGTLVAVGTANTITAAGNLEIGSKSGGGSRHAGRIQEVWIHNGTVWTDTQVWALYTKSSPAYSNQQFAGHNLEQSAILHNEPASPWEDLIALYKFGADGGLITDDEKGTYPLTQVGTIEKTSGIMGGTAGAASIPTAGNHYFYSDSLLDVIPSKAIAFDFWIMSYNGLPSAVQNIYYKGFADTSNRMYAYWQTYGQITFIFHNSTYPTSGRSLNTITVFNGRTTPWYHIAVCWDAKNGVRIWVNGVLECYDSTLTVMPIGGSSSNFEIGGYTGTSLGFSGKIANFRVRNKILTQEDIDVAYSTKYEWPVGAQYSLLTSTLSSYIKRYSDDDLLSQVDMASLETARKNDRIYRLGGVFNPSDSVKLLGRY